MFGEVEAARRSTTGRLVYATDRRHISSTSTPSDLSGRTFNQPFATILPNGSSNSRFQKEKKMSNHFTGLSLGPPFGDQRLDLCDLYAFQSPTDPSRTVIILNANPNADALHPDAIYRLAIDTDGDLVNDIAFSFVFSAPVDGRQTVNVFM